MVRRGSERDGTDVRGGTFLYLGEVVFMQCLYSLLNMSLLALEFFSPLFNYSFRISKSDKKCKNQHSRISLFQMPIFDPVKLTLRINFTKLTKIKQVNWNSLTVFKHVTLENYQDIRKIL